MAANNGNWHTASRWSRFLRPRFEVSIRDDWHPDTSAPTHCLIALHARRSAASVRRYAQVHPDRPCVLVLTGTDLYRDLPHDPAATASLRHATHLVVLQDAALERLAPVERRKCRVIYQSAPSLRPATPLRRSFEIVLVGHMRAEKDPLTPMVALQLLPPDSQVRLTYIGEALQEKYRLAAQRLAQSTSRYRWLGPCPHVQTRQRIRRAHLLLVSSIIEGGANVIAEAVTAGVPVLASRIPGNIGMLGEGYAGYFPAGDAPELALAMMRASRDASFVARLREQCARRAPLFAPERESQEVNRLLDDALSMHDPRVIRETHV
jgi:putative glycosyltransferase (TIGR04348 family)